ncbi:MAG: type IV pilus assembly protein PilY1, partial [Enterobacterales bacterium]
ESLTAPTKAGWFLALDPGEKVLAKSLTFSNRVIFSTYVPPSASNACAPPSGSGRLYAVSVIDGRPIIDLSTNADGDSIRAHLHSDRYLELNNIGIPPDPQVIILPGGPTLIVGRNAGDEIQKFLPTDFGEMIRVKWRERNNR